MRGLGASFRNAKEKGNFFEMPFAILQSDANIGVVRHRRPCETNEFAQRRPIFGGELEDEGIWSLRHFPYSSTWEPSGKSVAYASRTRETSTAEAALMHQGQ
jgi:hypothetical protein